MQLHIRWKKCFAAPSGFKFLEQDPDTPWYELTAPVEGEPGPRGVDGHSDGSNGGDGLLQRLLAALGQTVVAGAVSSAVLWSVAASLFLGREDKPDLRVRSRMLYFRSIFIFIVYDWGWYKVALHLCFWILAPVTELEPKHLDEAADVHRTRSELPTSTHTDTQQRSRWSLQDKLAVRSD